MILIKFGQGDISVGAQRADDECYLTITRMTGEHLELGEIAPEKYQRKMPEVVLSFDNVTSVDVVMEMLTAIKEELQKEDE